MGFEDKRQVYCLVERSVVFGYKQEFVGMYSCCVFLRYANNYMMVGFVFWL
jgi:hypothetical protein